MKREYLLITIALLMFLTTGCGAKNKKEVDSRSLSLER